MFSCNALYPRNDSSFLRVITSISINTLRSSLSSHYITIFVLFHEFLDDIIRGLTPTGHASSPVFIVSVRNVSHRRPRLRKRPISTSPSGHVIAYQKFFVPKLRYAESYSQKIWSIFSRALLESTDDFSC